MSGDPKPLGPIMAKSLANIRAMLAGRKPAQIESEIATRERLAREKARDVCKRRGIPEALWTLVADSEIETAALVACGAAFNARHQFQPFTLVLSGVPGSGKTSALAIVVGRYELAARFATARAITAPVPRDGFALDWISPDVLAIDEAGLEDRPEYITRLISERWDRCGMTIIATNLSAHEFVARYGDERVASRLNAQTFQWWQGLPAVDLRKRNTEH